MAQNENRWRGEGRDWRDDDREPNRHRDWGEARHAGVYDPDDYRSNDRENMYRPQAHLHQDERGHLYRDPGYRGQVGNESGGYGRDPNMDRGDSRRDNAREMERVYDRSFGGGRDMSRGGYGAGYGGRSGSSGYGGYAGAGNAGTEGNYTSRDVGSSEYRDRDYGVRPYGEGEQVVRGRGSLGYGGREYGERETGDRNYASRDYRNRDYGSQGGYGSGYGGGYESGRDRGEWERGGSSRRDFGGSSSTSYGGSYQRDEGRDRSWGEDRGGMYRAQEARGGYGGGRAERWGEDRGRTQQRGFWEQAGDEIASWFGDDDAERRRHEDERRASQHRGRGPRGYSRSDERVREDVSDRLTDDAYVDASDIEVAVSGGEVTLTGMVPDRQTKRRAEDVAEAVSGVTHVQNNLRVRSQTGNQGSSGWGSSTGAGASAMANAGSDTGTGSASGASTGISSGTTASAMGGTTGGLQGADTTVGTNVGIGASTGSGTGSAAPSSTGTGAGASGGPAGASAGTGSMTGSTTGVTGSSRSSTTRS
ncbi:BON domain-containing protein [Azospirillum sp. B21]|uniref:BON domain-containing protein n=1 Tax=Azospirillum sp. B21 TaxID=2607496 RepID=UPI0011EF2DA3|nr:BON domain-containing protein [Azospirillum sp. B21]KAA0581206.1 BON domain-containing protein [Azospirillum sp. B21]